MKMFSLQENKGADVPMPSTGEAYYPSLYINDTAEVSSIPVGSEVELHIKGKVSEQSSNTRNGKTTSSSTLKLMECSVTKAPKAKKGSCPQCAGSSSSAYCPNCGASMKG